MAELNEFSRMQEQVFFTGHIPQVTSTGPCVVDIQTNWTGSPDMLSRGHLLACLYIGSTCTMTCAYRTVESDL